MIAEVAKCVQLNLGPIVAFIIAEPVERSYVNLGPKLPFMIAGQRRTERSEVSRFIVGPNSPFHN